jgi:hypothetical protein
MSTKLFTALAIAGGLALGASQAQATVFTGTWELTNYENSDPGLVLGVHNLSPSAFSIDLGASDPQYLDLFKLYTNEETINPDDTAQSPIALKFAFSAPTPNTGPLEIGGTTQGWATFLGIYQGGQLTWANGGQATLQWANGVPGISAPGNMTLSVNGGTFNEGFFGVDEGKKHGMVVTAKFDWDNDPVGVPEPATWAMMIMGFGAAGSVIRRRRALAA